MRPTALGRRALPNPRTPSSPMRAWILVAATLLAVALASAILYRTYNFAQHTPGLCKSCHLMQTAYDTWSHSEHKDIECHDCHRASIADQNRYLLTMLFKRPKEVPARHGRVIVPRTICLQCHWEGDPKVTKVNASAGHSLHAFTHDIQCTSCHGLELHRFLPDSKVCARCHEQTVRARGMENHECQLCHVWKAQPASSESRGLMPTRATCLSCHQAFKPEIFPARAPMEFECSRCHQPHERPLPSAKDCLKCHVAVTRVGKHETHRAAGLACTDCHRPHQWRISEAQARVDCARCHEYRSPASFVAAAASDAAQATAAQAGDGRDLRGPEVIAAHSVRGVFEREGSRR